jgi:hypothetical protein
MTLLDTSSPFWDDPMVSPPPRIQAARDGLDVAEYDAGEAAAEALDLAADEKAVAVWEDAFRRGGGFWRGFYQAVTVLESSYAAPTAFREYQEAIRAKNMKKAEAFLAKCRAKVGAHRQAFKGWLKGKGLVEDRP